MMGVFRKSSGTITEGFMNRMGARHIYSSSPCFFKSARSCSFSFFSAGPAVKTVGLSFRLEKIKPAQSLRL
jgi:hypothetical protein